MADGGGPGHCERLGIPLETAPEMSPLKEERKSVSNQRACSLELPMSLGVKIPLQVPPSVSLVEVEPTFLPPRGRNLPLPHSLGSCGEEMPGARKGRGFVPTQLSHGDAGC